MRREIHTLFQYENLQGRHCLGEPRHRLESNIIVDVKDMYSEVIDWIDLHELRFQG
jgi:hypothetical protein